MDKHKLNKQQRQSARQQLQDVIIFAEFIHKLNNRLCAIQGTAQLALAKCRGFEDSLSHIEHIVNDTGVAVNHYSQKIQLKQKRTRSQNVAV